MSRAYSHSSTTLRLRRSKLITLPDSDACAIPCAGYGETSPHNLSIIASYVQTFPFARGCEEKAGLSLTREMAFDSHHRAPQGFTGHTGFKCPPQATIFTFIWFPIRLVKP